MTNRLDPAKLVDDATRILGSSIGDLIPPSAQRHLINAQRELLLAVAAMIEHHTSPADPEPPAGKSSGSGVKRTRAGTGRSRRPSRVELE